MPVVKYIFLSSLLVLFSCSGVDFPEVPDVVFSGKSTGIEYTNNDGETLVTAGTEEGLTGSVQAVLAKDGTDIFALTIVSGLFLSEDGGSSFEQIDAFSALGGTIGLWEDRLFVAGQTNGKYSDDFGKSFTDFSMPGLSTGWKLFIGNGWFLASDGGLTLYKANRSASSFTALTGLDVSSIANIYAKDKKILVSTAGGLELSDDSGSTWQTALAGQSVSSAILYKGHVLAMVGGTVYHASGFGKPFSAVIDPFVYQADNLFPPLAAAPPYTKFSAAGNKIAVVSNAHYCFVEATEEDIDFPFLCVQTTTNADVFVAEGFLDLGRE